MKNIHIVEDISADGARWYLFYKDPIRGVHIEIDESDARDILEKS